MLMFIPGSMTDIAGVAITVLFLFINMKKWERGPAFLMKHKK